jgi:tetratricopeptide (TPR) repeat protein
MPETILAMVEARLDRLEPEARRLLRAASVFGETFWEDGVRALVGADQDAETVARAFDMLVESELLVRRRESKFPGIPELGFRHALVREAAYAALTDRDRELGHRLAGEWLERAGETEPLLLGEHFERGGMQERAVPFFRDAAQSSLAGNDFEAAIARAERAIGCGASGELLGALRLTQAEAHRWLGDLAATAERANEALAELPRGTPAWAMAAGELAIGAARGGNFERVLRLSDELLLLCDADASPAVLVALGRAASQLAHAGHAERARLLVDRIESLADVADPLLMGHVQYLRSFEALLAGDLAMLRIRAEAAANYFEAGGDLRSACRARGNVGYACMLLGAYAEAESKLTEALDAAERLAIRSVAAHAQHNLGFVLGRLGKLDRAMVIESSAIAMNEASGDLRVLTASHAYLAHILLLGGDFDGALAAAERASDVSNGSLSTRPYALATLSLVCLLAGRTTEALTAAQEAVAIWTSLGDAEEGEGFVRIVHAEALAASQDQAEANRVVRLARARLMDKASRIQDPSLRASLLEKVPENARILARAEEWLGPLARAS